MKAIPKLFINCVEQGVKESLENGSLAGYQIIDIEVILVSASFKQEEASEMAYKIAAGSAFREATKMAGPLLMEPVFKVEVLVPEEFMGGVIGDLNSRRGKILNMIPKTRGIQIIDAEVPLVQMFGYATDLRSLTQGRGTFTMTFKEYSIIPPKTVQEILTRLGRI